MDYVNPIMRGKGWYQKIGERIMIQRRKNQLSQEKLAFASDIDRSYLARIEKGKANPTIKVLKKISLNLKLPLTNLFKKL